MILYLIRHGETPYNRDGLALGRADVPLTSFGEQQVAALGIRLAAERITRIFSSPLGRAMATARAVAGERPIVIEPRDELLEMDVGETEGLPFGEMRKRYPDFLRAWAGDGGEEMVMPGGESLRHVELRLMPFIDEVLALDEEGVAIVSHNFVTKVAICRLFGLGLGAFRSFGTDVASVSSFDVRHGRVVARTLNDTCHLHGLPARE